jgi:hypothetical protein
MTGTQQVTDPRFQADAYIACNEYLYEVVGWDDDKDRLHVRNCHTLNEYWLLPSRVLRSKLVKAAPDRLTVPAEWEHTVA